MSKNKFHDGAGPSQRQLRVGETVRRALSELLSRGDIHDPELNRLSITVGEVRCSPDLKIATAYVMPLGGGHVDDAIDLLAKNRGELRRQIGKKLNLKFTPDLRFRPDDTFDRLDETRRLFADETVRRDTGADQDDDAQGDDDRDDDERAGG
ncbi:30S ribosome-binding factor RbfA [Ferrimonas balearica]|nr:30S ribosome-binding factor RbfA [Ferrimonas balearica]